MNWPTWNSLAEAAINSMPSASDVFDEAQFQIDVTLEISSVRGSWAALGKSDQEVMAMVKENLRRKGKI